MAFSQIVASAAQAGPSIQAQGGLSKTEQRPNKQTLPLCLGELNSPKKPSKRVFRLKKTPSGAWPSAFLDYKSLAAADTCAGGEFLRGGPGLGGVTRAEVAL